MMRPAFIVAERDHGLSAIVDAAVRGRTTMHYIGPDPAEIMAGDPQTGRRLARGIAHATKRDYYPAYLEYGTSRMRARPFMRITFDRDGAFFEEYARKAIERVYARAGRVRGTHIAASLAATQRSIARVIEDRIKRTIRMMRLVDTGRLLHSIDVYKVEVM